MRIRVAAAILALVACGSPGSLPSSSDTPGSATTAPAATPAPDFTLALGNGETFSLSAETRPVFMVFWAEW